MALIEDVAEMENQRERDEEEQAQGAEYRRFLIELNGENAPL